MQVVPKKDVESGSCFRVSPDTSVEGAQGDDGHHDIDEIDWTKFLPPASSPDADDYLERASVFSFVGEEERAEDHILEDLANEAGLSSMPAEAFR